MAVIFNLVSGCASDKTPAPLPAWGYQSVNPKDIVSTFNPNYDGGINPLLNAQENMSASVLDSIVEGPWGLSTADTNIGIGEFARGNDPDFFNSYTGNNWLGNGNIRVIDNSAKQISDKVDSKGIFEFFLHYDKDLDKTNTDRQRIEIRGDSLGRNPVYAGQEDDIFTYFWKFWLPEDIVDVPPAGFFHIFQIKAVEGPEAGAPICTFTVDRNNLLFRNTSLGRSMHTTEVIASIPIKDALNKWLAAEVTLHYRDRSDTKPGTDNGYLYMKLTDLESGLVLMEEYKFCDLWRRPEEQNENGHWETDLPSREGQFIRPKWGLYRALNQTTRETTMRWGDFIIIKRDKDSYRFPNGYNPADAGGIPSRDSGQ